MLEALYDAVRELPAPLAVASLAAVPVAELRGAIPLGVFVFDLHPAVASVYAAAGNLIPVPIILLLLDPVSRWLRRRSDVMDRFFEHLFARTRARHGWRFDRFRDLALVTLVAIPFPLTGAWTGALCAFLFGVRPKRAFALISLGVAIAATIVGSAVAAGLGLFGSPVS